MFLVQYISFTYLMVIGHHYCLSEVLLNIMLIWGYLYLHNILFNNFISGVDADMLLSINWGGGYNYPRTIYIQIHVYAKPIYYPSYRPCNVIKQVYYLIMIMNKNPKM